MLFALRVLHANENLDLITAMCQCYALQLNKNKATISLRYISYLTLLAGLESYELSVAKCTLSQLFSFVDGTKRLFSSRTSDYTRG